MMSMQRQCNELVDLLTAIQTCVDREGWLIPYRAADFDVYIARGRELIGVH
jgi:hypothetical protein